VSSGPGGELRPRGQARGGQAPAGRAPARGRRAPARGCSGLKWVDGGGSNAGRSGTGLQRPGAGSAAVAPARGTCSGLE
jgi:hypothetical protein